MASTSIPLNVTASGPVPTPPATLWSILIQTVAAQQPDYTILPAGLIEDIASTDTGAVAMMDQMRVDAVNAIPVVSNAYLTTLLGQQAGIPQGTPTNTSVDVIFSTPSSGSGSSPGYTIPAGVIVSDGTYQYVTQEGTIISASTFSSGTVTAIATLSGSWAVPQGSVTQIITSIPTAYTITVTNPEAGIPALSSETLESYQARVTQAEQASGTGTVPYLKTLLQAVSGVVPRLVSVQQAGSGWKIIVGGGDAYAVAYAIYLSILNLSILVGSSSPTRNVSVPITDGTDTYTIIFINPPAQTVTGTVTWNTTLPNFTIGSQVNSLAAPAMTSYINSIPVGQPINLLEMTAAFQQAVTSVLPTVNLSALVFSIYINGVLTPPSAGTSTIFGDPESYFSAAQNAFAISQG
jgi:hypothetical protein